MALSRPDTRSAVIRHSVLMSEIDEIRSYQQNRVVAALESWEKSKKLLEAAIARVEAQEREYKAVSDDVRRKLEALDLVASMGNEAGHQMTSFSQDRSNSSVQALQRVPELSEGHTSVRSASVFSGVVSRSRTLFSAGVRSTQPTTLSILQEPTKLTGSVTR